MGKFARSLHLHLHLLKKQHNTEEGGVVKRGRKRKRGKIVLGGRKFFGEGRVKAIRKNNNIFIMV